MNKDEQVYKAKQEWYERIMASELTLAQKAFAFSLWKRAYGTKIESWPGTEEIMEDAGFTSHGHFTDYRKALADCGAITAVLAYHTKGAKQKNYKYTLNLNWDGSVAPHVPQKASAMAPQVPQKKAPSMAPQGSAVAPQESSHGTSGASNTTSNTTTKTTSNSGAIAPKAVEVKKKTSIPVEPPKAFDHLPPFNSSDEAEGVVTPASHRHGTSGATVDIDQRVSELMHDTSWGLSWTNPVVRQHEARVQAQRELVVS